MIKNNKTNQWISVADHPAAIKTNKQTDKLYCLNTSNNNIQIDGYNFLTHIKNCEILLNTVILPAFIIAVPTELANPAVAIDKISVIKYNQLGSPLLTHFFISYTNNIENKSSVTMTPTSVIFNPIIVAIPSGEYKKSLKSFSASKLTYFKILLQKF